MPVFACSCLFLPVCMYVCTYVCMHVCIYTHTYICMYVCMYIHAYIHTYVHTHMRTYTGRRRPPPSRQGRRRPVPGAPAQAACTGRAGLLLCPAAPWSSLPRPRAQHMLNGKFARSGSQFGSVADGDPSDTRFPRPSDVTRKDGAGGV